MAAEQQIPDERLENSLFESGDGTNDEDAELWNRDMEGLRKGLSLSRILDPNCALEEKVGE